MTEPLQLSDWPEPECGRGPAGAALLAWAGDPQAERLCLVTGSAGSGKSMLLAWFTAGRGYEERAMVNALVPGEGLGFGPAVWLLRQQLAYGAGSADGLLERAAADRRPMLIVLPDTHLLDDSGQRPGPLLVPEVIEPLLRLPWVRVLAEARDREKAGFTAEADGTAARVIDLDDPAMTDPAGYAAWYQELAGPQPVVPPEAVYPHPAHGRLAAALPEPLTDKRDEGNGPDVCGAWWASRTPAVRGALRTLAQARGWMGITTWRLLHSGLHPDDPGAAAAVDAAAAQLPGPVEYRLTLPRLTALARHADGSGEQFPDADRVFGLLVKLVPPGAGRRPDWEHAPAYVRGHLLVHAPGAREVATLLSDPGFLLHTAPEAITRALDNPRTVAPPSLRTVWYLAAPVFQGAELTVAERAAVLHTVALAHVPRLAELLAPVARESALTARWTLPRAELPVLDASAPATHWPGALEALAPTRDGSVLASDTLGLLRTLNAADGTVTGRIAGLPPSAPADLVELADGTRVTRDHDGVLRVADAADGELARALAAPAPRASSLGATADGRTLAVGDAEGGVRLFGVDGTPGERAVFSPAVPVTAVGVLRADDGAGLVVVAGLADASVQVWAPPKPPLERALTFRGCLPIALATARTRVGPVIAVAWSDQVVTVRRLGSGPAREAHAYHDVLALALTEDGILIGAGYDGVTAWDCDLDALA